MMKNSMAAHAWHILLIVSLVSFISLGAKAEESVSSTKEEVTLTQEQLDQAEIVFFKGLTAYQSSRYSDAAVAFQEALLIVQNRDLFYNLARSREQLGDRLGAIKWYQSYLDSQPVDETAVIHRIKELGGQPRVSGAQPTQAPKPQAREVRIVTQGPSVLPWVGLALGVSGVALSLWFQERALSNANLARQSEDQGAWTRYKEASESEQLSADLCLGLSITSLVSALYLWWDEEKTSSSPESATPNALQLIPSTDGAYATYQGNF